MVKIKSFLKENRIRDGNLKHIDKGNKVAPKVLDNERAN